MTLNYLGYMLADKGIRLPEALKLIRKAVEQEPMNGAYLDSLGWAYFKLGEYELAEENLRQAVERDQTDPTVHDHLGDLYEKTGRIRLAAAQWEISLLGIRQVSRTPMWNPATSPKYSTSWRLRASSSPSRRARPAEPRPNRRRLPGSRSCEIRSRKSLLPHLGEQMSS